MHRRSTLTMLIAAVYFCCTNTFAMKMSHDHLETLNKTPVSLANHMQIIIQLGIHKEITPLLVQQGVWDVQTAIAFNQLYIDLALKPEKSLYRSDAVNLCHKTLSNFKGLYTEPFFHDAVLRHLDGLEQIDGLAHALYESSRIKVAIPYLREDEKGGRLSCVSNVDDTHVDIRDFMNITKPDLAEQRKG